MSVSVLDEENTARRFRLVHQEQAEVQSYNSLSLRELLNVLRRRFMLMATVLVLGVALSYIVANELPRTYSARSMIVLEPEDPNLLGDTSTSPDRVTIQSKIDTEADLITSRNFAGRVVDSLNLIANPDFNTFLQQSHMSREEQGQSSGPLLSLVDSVKKLFSGSDADNAVLPPLAIQRDQAITSYLSRLTHSQSGESLAMSVTLTADTPQMAATLANATTDIYIAWSRDLKRERTREAVQFLRQQAEELGARIAKIEGNIADYGRINGVSSDPRDDLLRAAMQHANDQLSQARADLAQAQSRLAQAKKAAVDGAPNEVQGARPGEESALSSPFLTSLRNDEAVVLRERAQLSRNYGVNHPLVQEADAKIASVRKLIAAELDRIVTGLENDVRVAQGRVDRFEQELAKAEKELRQRSSAEIRLRELNRNLVTEQKLYDVVADRLGKLDPYAEVAEPGSWIVSRAAVPDKPSSPKVFILMMGGVVGSLVLALVAAATLESLDPRICDPRRASHLLGLPLLASIPALSRSFLRRRPRVAHQLLQYPRSAVAEAFRALYGACRRFNRGSRKQAILVSSAVSKEGATTTAIGLAVAAALDDARTVLLDLAPRTGGVEAALQTRGAARDLDDYFDGYCSIHDVLEAASDVPLLDVLEASTDRVLSSDQLETLMDALKLSYDVVIVNGPPVLVLEDAVRVAGLVDGVVLVAAVDRTKEEPLRLAAERFHLADAPLVGLVFNKFDRSLENGDLSRPRKRPLPEPRPARASFLARFFGRKNKPVLSRPEPVSPVS